MVKVNEFSTEDKLYVNKSDVPYAMMCSDHIKSLIRVMSLDQIQKSVGFLKNEKYVS